MLSRYIGSWDGYQLHIGSNLPPKYNLWKEDKSSAPKVSFIRRFHCTHGIQLCSKLLLMWRNVIVAQGAYPQFFPRNGDRAISICLHQELTPPIHTHMLAYIIIQMHTHTHTHMDFTLPFQLIECNSHIVTIARITSSNFACTTVTQWHPEGALELMPPLATHPDQSITDSSAHHNTHCQPRESESLKYQTRSQPKKQCQTGTECQCQSQTKKKSWWYHTVHMAMSPTLNSHLDKVCVTALSSKLVFLSIACLAASYVVRSVEQGGILIAWHVVVPGTCIQMDRDWHT